MFCQLGLQNKNSVYRTKTGLKTKLCICNYVIFTVPFQYSITQNWSKKFTKAAYNSDPSVIIGIVRISLFKMGIIHPVAHAAGKWPQFKILLKSLYNRGSKTSLHFINNSFARPSSAQLLPAFSFLIADSISDIVIFLSKFSKTLLWSTVCSNSGALSSSLDIKFLKYS